MNIIRWLLSFTPLMLRQDARRQIHDAITFKGITTGNVRRGSRSLYTRVLSYVGEDEHYESLKVWSEARGRIPYFPDVEFQAVPLGRSE